MTETTSPDMTQWFVAIGLFMAVIVGLVLYRFIHPDPTSDSKPKPPEDLT